MNPRPPASFDEQEIDRLLNQALKFLCERDKFLFDDDASERAICHRLALYLQEVFPDFHVDCEYNRHHNEDSLCKRLRAVDVLKAAGRQPDIGDGDSVTVFPDIIVHRRRTNDNLLVIEAKKTTSSVPDGYDKKKLVAYQTELGYRFGKLLRFGTRNNEKPIDLNIFVRSEE
jgi:hypothetical protein